MPGVTLHFVLAGRALERWNASAQTVPFDPLDPLTLNAFYHGAVGPDLGYFPGGVKILSDLAHCVRTGALTRALLSAARDDRQRAFAWGWATHVLSDQAIHPLIGLGVGELLTGSRDRFVDGSSDLLPHVRVELGVDACYARRHPVDRARRLRSCFEERDLSFLVQAYHDTYGVAVPVDLFRLSHAATTRRSAQALATLGLVESLMDDEGLGVWPAVRRVLLAATRLRGLRSMALAYLTPVRPSTWLIEAIDGTCDAFVERFLDAVRSEGRTVEDLNLDTGRPCLSDPAHQGTRRALDGLDAMGATPGRGPLADLLRARRPVEA